MGRTFWLCERARARRRGGAEWYVRGAIVGALTRERDVSDTSHIPHTSRTPAATAFYWLVSPEWFRRVFLLCEGDGGTRVSRRPVVMDERDRVYTAREFAHIILYPHCYWHREWVGRGVLPMPDVPLATLQTLETALKIDTDHEPDTDANDGIRSPAGALRWGRAWAPEYDSAAGFKVARLFKE